MRVRRASEGRWKTNRGMDRTRDARREWRTRGRVRPRARATTLPARRPETAKPLRGKRLEFGGNKRAGEGTHQATGVGARRATFLRMNLNCREVRVPWVRPADARLIASILVNDTPHATLRRCPSTHRCRIASCHWAAVASRSAPPVVDVSGWISMNSRRNPRFHRRRTPCARTNRSRGARGSHFVRDVARGISQADA